MATVISRANAAEDFVFTQYYPVLPLYLEFPCRTSGFHDVYTDKETAEAYRKTGKFPDGATLVKELRASASGDYTTGTGVSYATDGLKQWFVMIEDAKGRFADNPLWGDGWETATTYCPVRSLI